TQQMPPNQLLVGLALFITFFLMSPAFVEINNKAVKPFMDGQIGREVALQEALLPLRKFMFNQTREEDLRLFIKVSGQDQPRTRAEVSTMVLVPAFVISE